MEKMKGGDGRRKELCWEGDDRKGSGTGGRMRPGGVPDIQVYARKPSGRSPAFCSDSQHTGLKPRQIIVIQQHPVGPAGVDMANRSLDSRRDNAIQPAIVEQLGSEQYRRGSSDPPAGAPAKALQPELQLQFFHSYPRFRVPGDSRIRTPEFPPGRPATARTRGKSGRVIG